VAIFRRMYSSDMEVTPSNETQDLGLSLKLPFKSIAPTTKSDALDDVHIRFSELVNYIGEVLLTSHLVKEVSTPLDNGAIPIHLKSNRSGDIVVPTVEIQASEWDQLSINLLHRLFLSSIVQLATLYEVFLAELIEDILLRNNEWLELDERQLTAKEIFKLGSIENIRAKLIDRKILDFAMLSYPKKVEKFQKEFHVGLHHKTFPLSLFEVHDFLEVRNVIVHSDGHASDQYLERMSSYHQLSLLRWKYDTLGINFSWLLTFGQQLIFLCNLVDEEVSKKWTTTRNSAT
jgi:hypothetical protein